MPMSSWLPWLLFGLALAVWPLVWFGGVWHEQIRADAALMVKNRMAEQRADAALASAEQEAAEVREAAQQDADMLERAATAAAADALRRASGGQPMLTDETEGSTS